MPFYALPYSIHPISTIPLYPYCKLACFFYLCLPCVLNRRPLDVHWIHVLMSYPLSHDDLHTNSTNFWKKYSTCRSYIYSYYANQY